MPVEFFTKNQNMRTPIPMAKLSASSPKGGTYLAVNKAGDNNWLNGLKFVEVGIDVLSRHLYLKATDGTTGYKVQRNANDQTRITVPTRAVKKYNLRHFFDSNTPVKFVTRSNDELVFQY